MRILLVEDDGALRWMLQRTLEAAGHDITGVGNGTEALAVLTETPVNVLLVDWMMPVMDGIELCRRVRAADWGRYVYIIMITALSENQHIETAAEVGVDDYIAKPFGEPQLFARLKAAERIVSLESQLSRRVAELEASLRKIKQLKELLPICMYCKKIRDDDNYWQQIETYIHREVGTDFTHGICPDCYETIVEPQLAAIPPDEAAPTPRSDT